MGSAVRDGSALHLRLRSCLLPKLKLRCPRLRRSTCGDVDDSLGEGLRCFLWQVMSDAARDVSMLIPPGEHLRVRGRIWVRRTVGVAFHCDGRHGYDRALGKSLFKLSVFRFAFS